MHSKLALLAVPAVLGALTLSGCGSTAHTEQQTLDHRSARLDVVSNNANMPLTFTTGDAGKVTVSVTTQTALKDSKKPELRLDGDSLRIGSPCADTWVGYCEATFTVKVAPGTTVTLNGQPAVVR